MSRQKVPTLQQFIAGVDKRNLGQPEFIQAVAEVAADVLPYIEKHSHYNDLQLLERIAPVSSRVTQTFCEP